MDLKRQINRFPLEDFRVGFFPPYEKPTVKSRIRLMKNSGEDPLTFDYWIVNDTSEVLERIVVRHSGWASTDDETIALECADDYCYLNIQPHEAVLVGHVHEVRDSDFVLVLDIGIHHHNGETKNIRLCGKGEYGRNRILSHE